MAATEEVRFTTCVVPAEQIVWLNGALVTEGRGFTVITTVIGEPGHDTLLFERTGVIVYVTVCATVLLFIGVCVIIFPFPADTPVILPLLVTVQLKTVLLTVEVKAMYAGEPEHIVCEEGVALTAGIGFTVML